MGKSKRTINYSKKITRLSLKSFFNKLNVLTPVQFKAELETQKLDHILFVILFQSTSCPLCFSLI